VYITEAHAIDEWPLGNEISVCYQPKSNSSRISLAKSYRQQFDLKVPILVDTIENKFEKEYSLWPFRFYIMVGGRVVKKAQPRAENDPGEFSYDIDEIRQWLANRTLI